MKLRPWILALALALTTSCWSGSAAAQDGYGFGLGLGFSQGYFNAMRGAERGRVPHFALYPPVYYGAKVARPYGFSPFATPPGIVPVETQFVPPPHMKEIANPYFRPSNQRSTEAAPQGPGNQAPALQAPANRPALRDQAT